MGSSTDALKLVSSLTLFGHAAKELHGRGWAAAYGALARVAAAVLKAPSRKATVPASTR